jgi:hypothetical protein
MMHGKIVVRRRLKRKMQRAESGIKISRIPFSPEAEPPAAPPVPVPVLNKSWKHWDVLRVSVVAGAVVPAIIGNRKIDRAVVLADSGNGGTIYIAPTSPSATKGIPLIANGSVTLFAKDLADIKFGGSAGTQIAHVWYYWDD